MTYWVKLDLDRRHRRPGRARYRALLARAGYRLRRMVIDRSPSGTGFHVQLLIDPVPTTAVEIVALQAVLGSDPGRESVNLLRARAVDAGTVSAWWRSRWNVLYSA